MGTGQLFSIVAVLGLFAAGCSSGETETADVTTTAVAESSTTAAPEATTAPETTAAPATTEAATTTAASTTTEATTTTTAAPETTAPPAAELPQTTITAILGGPYTFQGGTPDPALLPAPEGSVTAMWYRAGEVYAVVYSGLDPTVDACPGNSALTASGFEFISNAELPNGACPDFPTRIDNSATQGVQICGDVVSYLTLIPSDTVAQVFASVEKPDPAVIGTGITAPALIDDPSSVPEIDPALLSC